jgi:hypothetical protein
MKKSRRISAGVLSLVIATTALAGCSSPAPQTSPPPTAESREASETIKGTRLCFTPSSVSGMQVRGSSLLNDFFEWKGWEPLVAGQENCLDGTISTSVVIDRGTGPKSMWTDLKCEVRFGDKTTLRFFGDNPWLGAPMVGWSSTGADGTWQYETFLNGSTTSVNYGGHWFTVERRADSDRLKEYLITFTN